MQDNAACLNRETGLAAPPPAFCPVYGQETRTELPSLREYAQQFDGAYVPTEGALWRTLNVLVTKPGELTKQYLAGRREHFVLPSRLRWAGLAWMVAYTLLAGRRDRGHWAPRLARGLTLSLVYMALPAIAVPVAWTLASLA
jgi:hypothetical protein